MVSTSHHAIANLVKLSDVVKKESGQELAAADNQ